MVVFFFPLSLLFFSRFSLHVLNFRPYVVGRSWLARGGSETSRPQPARAHVDAASMGAAVRARDKVHRHRGCCTSSRSRSRGVALLHAHGRDSERGLGRPALHLDGSGSGVRYAPLQVPAPEAQEEVASAAENIAAGAAQAQPLLIYRDSSVAYSPCWLCVGRWRGSGLICSRRRWNRGRGGWLR